MASCSTSSWAVPWTAYLGGWGFASLGNKYTTAWLSDEGTILWLGNRLSEIHQLPRNLVSKESLLFRPFGPVLVTFPHYPVTVKNGERKVLIACAPAHATVA